MALRQRARSVGLSSSEKPAAKTVPAPVARGRARTFTALAGLDTDDAASPPRSTRGGSEEEKGDRRQVAPAPPTRFAREHGSSPPFRLRVVASPRRARTRPSPNRRAPTPTSTSRRSPASACKARVMGTGGGGSALVSRARGLHFPSHADSDDHTNPVSSPLARRTAKTPGARLQPSLRRSLSAGSPCSSGSSGVVEEEVQPVESPPPPTNSPGGSFRQGLPGTPRDPWAAASGDRFEEAFRLERMR